MPRPFFRMGDPIRIPVNGADSASTPFEITLPNNVQSFLLYNPNPFFCRLRGQNEGRPFVAVTNQTGWPMPPDTLTGPFSTQNPIAISAQAFALPNRPLVNDEGAPFDFTGCWVELIYGSGD